MIIRSNQPLENHMVLGPYYDTSGCDEGCCHFCGNVYAYDEMTEFYDGYICDDCKAECPECGDWLRDDPQVILEGQRCHKQCALDAGYEDEEARQHAYDAHIDRLIDERREERRRA